MEQESYPNSIVTAYNLSLARNLKEFSKLIRVLPENISVMVVAYYCQYFLFSFISKELLFLTIPKYHLLTKQTMHLRSSF